MSGVLSEILSRRAFPVAGLIDTIVARMSRQIGDFFARYVRGAEHLPV